MKIVNKPFRLDEFQAHLDTITLTGFKPQFVVIHHTAAPSLAQRPLGWTAQHMLNLQDFYEEKGWSAGPHIFTDEDQAWMFTPLNVRGVHAVAFNRTGWGIEMLGDYDNEDPWTGRGLAVLTLTARIAIMLLRKIGKGTEAIRFHRDDPGTSKSCPGRKISKADFLKLVK